MGSSFLWSGSTMAQSPSSDQFTSVPRPPLAIWKDINGRITPDQLFSKVLMLAGRLEITPKEVEQVFGIEFAPPESSKFSGLMFRPKQSASYVEGGLTLSIDKEKKAWKISLVGFSDGVDASRCLKFGHVLHTILVRDWVEQRTPTEHVDYEYVKRTGKTVSKFIIGNRELTEPMACTGSLYFATWVPGPSTAN
jgi:hypothetical protein